MWPLYLILDKFLKAEDENADLSNGDHSTFVGASSFFGWPLNIVRSYNSCLPRSQFVQVPHVSQLHSWDCGLACVSMVLSTLGIEHCDLHSLGKLCCTTSVWTVDLAYLLQKFSVSFWFFTITLGVDPNFRVETFYKEQLSNDLVRVDRLFQQALEAGISIQCRSINGEEISILILSGKYIAIALVDQYKMDRYWLEDVCVSGFYGGDSGYTGHYIVVCGYDADRDEFEIRDPASSRKSARISLQCLDEARKSFGTDEDLILISLEKKDGMNNSHCNLDNLET
ncbi:guanylyl cyclase 1-like [Telopea speciosissima]|uniref:guanylyl cyclase 1-like n=1 Tax=Telopea speciosissima TaxID=54955 RepID=UPI001CC76B99|nr:guanylyl cyclase 1-like [Telopea speciosissima]